MSEEYKPFKKKMRKDWDEEEVTSTPIIEEVIYSQNIQPTPSNEIDPFIEQPKYFIGAILMCDAGLTYAVIETFTNSCVVEPIDNDDCFASEVMSFKAMKKEGWRIIGQQI